MSEPRTPWRPARHDILAAFALLTRIPLPVDHARAGARGAAAAWSYPVIGMVLGGAAGLLGWAATAIGLPMGAAAALMLALLALSTGALHEDGLSDCADGIGGGRDREHTLTIMKDSRIGAFGATALGLALIMRWSLLSEMSATWLIWAGILAGAWSRASMVFAMQALPHARPNGLAAQVGKPGWGAAALAVLISCAVSILSPLGAASLLLPLGPLLFALPLCLMARKKLGGQTGDVLGGVQQLAEIGTYCALIVLNTPHFT